MKNLILILVLLIPFSLFAQDKSDVNAATMNDQTDEWMTKISSDSEMRGQMMDMMIEETSGNKEEMMKLVNSMLNNAEMNKMMLATNSGRAGNISLEPRGTMNDSEVEKEITTKPLHKK
jgi:hypothetical protein